MSKTPTFAPASVLARPCASWSVAFVPSAAPSAIPVVPAPCTWQIDAEDLGVGGHMYSNHGTTGSKRPNPGHLDEVST